MKFQGPPKCKLCDTSVYPIEQMVVDKKTFHKTCFKCEHCKRLLTLSNFASVSDKFYCKVHFKELFSAAGGKYTAFGEDKFKHKAGNNDDITGGWLTGTTKAMSVTEKANLASLKSKEDTKRNGTILSNDNSNSPSTRIKSSSSENKKANDDKKSIPSISNSISKKEEPSSLTGKSFKLRMKEYEKNANSNSSTSSNDDVEELKKRNEEKEKLKKKEEIAKKQKAEKAALLELKKKEEELIEKKKEEKELAIKKKAEEAALFIKRKNEEIVKKKKDEANALAVKKREEEELARCVSASTITSMASSLVTGSSDDELQIENATLQSKIKLLDNENTNLKRQVHDLKKQVSILTAKAMESDEWVAKLSKDLESSKSSNIMKSKEVSKQFKIVSKKSSSSSSSTKDIDNIGRSNNSSNNNDNNKNNDSGSFNSRDIVEPIKSAVKPPTSKQPKTKLQAFLAGTN